MSLQAIFYLKRPNFTLDIEFQAPARGVTALFGPSGSGKSTTLRLIAGLERVRSGALFVNGKIWQDNHHFFPAHQRPIGYVFQETALFPHLSVRQNLLYGHDRIPPEKRRVTLEQAIELTGAAHLLDRPVPGLSGGERQRVAIARALLVSPQLLLMDEPLASLDQQTKKEILHCLQHLFQELAIPVIYVSHATDEVAQLADHLVLVNNGSVQATGPAREMLTRLDLFPAESDEAAAVIQATVTAHDDAFRLTELSFANEKLFLPREDLPLGTVVRIAIHARDVSLALNRPEKSSILNIIPAKVLEITESSPAQVNIRLAAGEFILLARLTKKSADALAIAPGKQVYAQVKSIGLIES